jgi:hypothetical protein
MRCSAPPKTVESVLRNGGRAQGIRVAARRQLTVCDREAYRRPVFQQEKSVMRAQRILVRVALAACIGPMSFAWATGTSQPKPPSQVCVNNQCVADANSATGGAVKWNPGHYMASDAVMSAGKPLSYIQSEIDDLNNQDNVLGYRAWFTWGALEPTEGNYDFSTVDAVLARLKTAYKKPKRLVIGLWIYGQHALGSNTGATVPLYIQQNSTYGASPVSGSYGWWGMNANGQSTGLYAAALYNPAVMNRFIALVQALGQHLDNEPYFEGLVIQEDASVAEAASAWPPVDPKYSDGAWLSQLERLLTAATGAFPHTSVVMQNSWFDRPPSGVALEQWMASNRIAAGSPDSWGQSSISKYTPAKLSDGIQTLLGVSQYGGTVDLRPKMTAMMEVQSPDMVGNYFGNYGGPWTPLDLIAAFNQTYHASHVFWTHLIGTEQLYGSGVPAAVKWSNLAPVLNTHPLTNTSYPGNYPGG